jgi:hypothetical protein
MQLTVSGLARLYAWPGAKRLDSYLETQQLIAALKMWRADTTPESGTSISGSNRPFSKPSAGKMLERTRYMPAQPRS